MVTELTDDEFAVLLSAVGAARYRLQQAYEKELPAERQELVIAIERMEKVIVFIFNLWSEQRGKEMDLIRYFRSLPANAQEVIAGVGIVLVVLGVLLLAVA